jgi:hypothetical protein
MTTRRIYAADMFASSTFALGDEQQHMLDSSILAQSILGTSTLLYGLTCVPTGPASLSVVINPGAIFSYEEINETAFGVLPTLPIDTNQVLKYAYITDPVTPPAIVPPVTVGDSRNDLVQFQFSEADGNNQTIPFWGGVTYITIGSTQVPIPNAPTSLAVDTQRIDSITITIKTGVPAPTGTQTTPTPDAGFTGAWVITTAQGQTTITSGNITEYPNAPFITESLTQKISQATADARYAQIPQVLFKDGIINGGMVIAQREDFSLIGGSPGYGLVDGMIGQVTGTAITAGTLTQATAQSFTTTGYALLFNGVTVTGTGVVKATYRMESNDAVNYLNRTCSFSCIVNHNVGSSINYTVTISVANSLNDFSAVTTVQTSSAQPVASATPTLVSLVNVVMPDTTNGIQILVSAASGAVTTKNFYISDMILNTGEVAIPFVPQDQNTTRLRCMRSYRKSYEDGVAVGTVTGIGAQFTVSSGTGVGTALLTINIWSDVTGAIGKMRSAAGGGADISAAPNGSEATKSFVIANTAGTTDETDHSFHYEAKFDL